MKKSKKSSAVSWQSLCLIILCLFLGIVLVTLIAATAYFNHLLSFVTHNNNSDIDGTLSPDVLATATDDDYNGDFTGPSTDHGDIVLSTLPTLTPDEMIVEGVYNIMLIGEDRRPGEDRQRSDSMILCSFNTNSNSIDMISFLRDTYVAIPGHNANKMNAAYQIGGVSLLDQTMALNYGVHVDANIVVNFEGFKSIIDMLGGVDITLTAAEADHLNGRYGYELSAGKQHLDGEQALNYSRIRKIDWDINRTQRQRNVLTALLNSFKNKNITEMVSIATNILQSGYIQTDMSADEIRGYIITLFPMLSSADVTNQHIPALDTFSEMSIGTLTYCKVPDLEANRKILKEIFEAT